MRKCKKCLKPISNCRCNNGPIVDNDDIPSRIDFYDPPPIFFGMDFNEPSTGTISNDFDFGGGSGGGAGASDSWDSGSCDSGGGSCGCD